MITLQNPTGRKTPAHIVTIGTWELFFSYQTLIAARGPGFRYRIANSWGPTTGRHFRELHCDTFSVFDGDDFEATVEDWMNAGVAK